MTDNSDYFNENLEAAAEAEAHAKADADYFAENRGATAQTPSLVIPRIFEPFEPLNIADIDFGNVRPRRWVYGNRLLRGYVSGFCGMGATGKTSLAMGHGISIADGRSVFLLDDEIEEEAHKVHVRGPVLIWTLEDNEDELIIRLAGELKHRGIDPRKLRDMVFLASGRDHPFCAASLDKGGRVVKHDITPALDMIKKYGLVAGFFDPFVNSHALDGNRNDHVTPVLDQFRDIATHGDIAAHINHHFRKGGVLGDAQSALGAVSFTNACRVVETVSTMSEDDARAYGIDPLKRHAYVRIDNAKANLSQAGQTEWYQFQSVNIGNGNMDPLYPKGDSVGVLVRWTPKDSLIGYSWQQISSLLDAIEAGVDGEYYTSDAKASRWAGKLIMEHLGMSADQARLQMKDWLGGKDAPVLRKGSYISKERSNQKAMKLEVVPVGKEALKSRMAARV